MLALIWKSCKESLELVPLLLAIYAGIAWLEARFEERLQVRIRRAGHTGPLLGALFGCLPQCGFSVVGSALYTRGLISMGTLLAVFISTSDEALPVMLAHPSRLGLILPLLGTKVALALLAGYLVDAVARSPHRVAVPATQVAAGHEDAAENCLVEVDGCCGHHLSGKNAVQALIIHPLLHTLQVFLVLLIVTFAIDLLLGKEGANLGEFLLQGSIWQPVIAALVGLVPNCGASVAITQVYLNDGISFGAVIAGLSSSAGLGMLVLVKENRPARDTLRILGLLLGISMTAGILIQLLVER